MELLKVLALHGPNVWGLSPVLEVWLDAGGDFRPAADQLAAIAERLVQLAQPYVQPNDLRFDLQQPGRPPLILANWLEQLTRKLQSLCGIEMRPGRVLESSPAGVCRIAIRFEDEGLARPAFRIAYSLLAAALGQKSAPDAPPAGDAAEFDFAAKLRELQALANELCFGPSTRAIVEAARARGIPVRRLNENSFVQFGHGAQQRRICTAETDGTGAIAESIAQDKELTKSLLRRVGIPVPQGRPAESPEDAWQVACEIGIPVVVKPRDANHGRGVAIKLALRERIMAAYLHAAKEGSGVLIEQFVPGVVHRLLVVGNRVVAASRGEPDQVVGDGQHTVSQLVDLANLDPRRGDAYALPMCRMKIDATALVLLDQQGYPPPSVPPAGLTVVIRRNGEYTTDVTDHLHPEVAARAVLAARVVGLDVAGIDLVAEDVSRPLEEQGGMVIEVNAGPGLQMHSEPQIGRPRPVGAAIVDTLYPDGQSGRIPIVALAGGAGAAIAAQVTAHLLRQSGLTVGLAGSIGTFVGDRRLAGNRSAAGQRSLGPGPAELFLNPFVEAGVFEISATAVYTEGLPFDDCDVAVIEPLTARVDQLSVSTTDSLRGLHADDAWREIIVQSVSPLGTAVFDADDPSADRLALVCRGSVLYCHTAELHPRLLRHRSGGGKIVFLRGTTIWLASGEREFAVAQLNLALAACAGAVLVGVAAAWSAGMPIDLVGRGLESLGELAIPASLDPSADGSSTACPEQPRAA
jgi:cyanophycin synthetase